MSILELTVDTRDPAGPLAVRRALTEIIVPRTAAIFRMVWIVVVAIGFAGWSISETVPPLAILVAAGCVTGVVVVAAAVRLGAIPLAPAVVLDITVFLCLMVVQMWLVPANLVGDGTNWVMAGASISILIAGWVLPAVAALAVAACFVGAYLVALILAAHPVAHNEMFTAVVMLTQGALAVTTVVLVRRAAGRADAALRRRESTERAAAIEEQRDHAIAEQKRLLHDQVSASLWLLADGLLGQADARSRAAQALDSLEKLAAPPVAAQAAPADRLAQAVDDLRREGLVVDLLWQRPERRWWRWAAGDRTGWMPGVVVDAVVRAMCEALTNTMRYGGAVATVVADVRPSRLRVEISDRGPGIDPDNQPATSGIADSIRRRLEEVGGTATLTTDRHGVRWELAWKGSEVLRRRAAPLVHTALATHGRAFVRMFAVVAVVFHLLGAVESHNRPEDFRSVPLTVACWIAMLAAGATLYACVRWEGMTPFLAGCLGVTIIGVGLVSAVDCQPGAEQGFANWPMGSTGWFLIGLAAFLPISRVVIAVLAATVGNAVLVSLVNQPDTSGLLKLAGVTAAVGTLLIGAVIAFGVMREVTTSTARNLWKASTAAAVRIAESEAAKHRRSYFETGDTRLLGLLSDIAGGHLDPASASTRARCRHAREMLRRFAGLRAAGCGELIPAVAAADVAGLEVRMPVRHRLDRIPAPERRWIGEFVCAAVVLADQGEVIITVQEGADLLEPPGTARSRGPRSRSALPPAPPTRRSAAS